MFAVNMPPGLWYFAVAAQLDKDTGHCKGRARSAHGLDVGGSRGDGTKWLNAGGILKRQKTGCSE